jgi:hypothetical protein
MQGTRNMRLQKRLAALVLTGFFAASPGARAESATLDLELNKLTDSQKGCKVSFVMRNGLQSVIEALSLEIVLFGKDGRVANILSLKVGDLPIGKTLVKQFRFKSCNNVSRILVNQVSECRGANLTPKICSQKLKTTNKTKVQFGL